MAAGPPVLRERSSAATPATCGDAIDVPENETMPPPSRVEGMPTPGAQMSTQDPKLLKDASRLFMSVAAVVMMPLFVPAPARAGDELQAFAPLFPAASATTKP